MTDVITKATETLANATNEVSKISKELQGTNQERIFYNQCVIAAMSALIAKMPVHDREEGADVDTIRQDIAKSADCYAASMVICSRTRHAS